MNSTRRRKCRVWWPANLPQTQQPDSSSSSTFLFGWFLFSSPTTLDIIVSFTFDEASISPSAQSRFQGILHHTNRNMPAFLQDKCRFSMLGYCSAGSSTKAQVLRGIADEGDMLAQNSEQWRCGCHKVKGVLGKSRLAYLKKNNWIHLLYGPCENIAGNIGWIPKFHHIHWAGETVFHLDLHVIVYETPVFGGHHFSLSLMSSLDQLKNPHKKPKWVEGLHQKQPLLDLDTVILAINSASSAKVSFEELLFPERSVARFRILCMFLTFTWKSLAVSVASLSTLIYIIIQILHVLLSYGSKSSVYTISAKLFCNTWKNIRIRSCQILYWPIFLQSNCQRSTSCVEYAEKAALHKHSMWSSVVVDTFLGNLACMVLSYHAESACMLVSNFAQDVTNNLLRMGCVWLMGIPAGFKLNTELAGVLGMISLNAIQIWSTLWFFARFFFSYFIKGLAISGVIFGLTTPAALVMDMILLATMHVRTLHWLISLLYTQQIQAIASLWRLFRGQKWNPLRQRLDSYDYTVEQHIVGSLLFTPLILLLPTTSAFYIFFTIMNTTISFICIYIEVAISLIHATPYAKMFLWLVRPERFPSGIWFEILSCQSDAIGASEIGHVKKHGSSSEMSWKRTNNSQSSSNVLVTYLQGNSLNIGQILWPHYRCISSGISRSSVASSAYGVLTGRSAPSALGTGVPLKMQWMFIPYKEYWRLCRDAILACKPGCKSQLHY